MVNYEAPEGTPHPKRFSSFSYKRAGLVFVIIIILLIANGQVFEWAKQVGISKYNNRDLPRKVFGMAFDSNDNFWVGGEEFTPHPVGKTRYFVTMMYSDHKLISLAKTRTYEIHVPSPEPGQPSIRPSIVVDSDDQVWIGGYFGLHRLSQQGKWIPEWGGNSLENDIYALAADQQGSIWVATRDYLSKYVDGKRTDFPAEISKDLEVDPQGRVWLLDRDNNFSYLTPDGNWEHNALPIQALSFAIDADGRVWARIASGIAVCNPDTQKCSVYRWYNSNIPSGPEMAFDNENKLWLPRSSVGYYQEGGHFGVIEVDEILPVSLLNGLWTLRLALEIVLALAIYFFIVRFFDNRKKETLPISMTRRSILKRNRLILVLFGIAGPVVIWLTIGVLPQVELLSLDYIAIIYIGLLGAAIMLTRLYSYRTVGIHIPKKDAAQSVIAGALIPTACMLLSFYTLFRLLLMFLISE